MFFHLTSEIKTRKGLEGRWHRAAVALLPRVSLALGQAVLASRSALITALLTLTKVLTAQGAARWAGQWQCPGSCRAPVHRPCARLRAGTSASPSVKKTRNVNPKRFHDRDILWASHNTSACKCNAASRSRLCWQSRLPSPAWTTAALGREGVRRLCTLRVCPCTLSLGTTFLDAC